MTREEHEAVAAAVAGDARMRERLAFQVRHPHYTPPPMIFGEAYVKFRAAHEEAVLAFAQQGQRYNRDGVWLVAWGAPSMEAVLVSYE